VKQGATNHPKMSELAELIMVRLSEGSLGGAGLPFDTCHSLAVGLCEKLWHYASQYAPAGDIGKLAPSRIAAAIGWDQKDAAFIIEALVKVRLCDRPGDHSTLVVHDWSAHATRQVHGALARARALFCDGRKPNLSAVHSDDRDDIKADYETVKVKKPRSRGRQPRKPATNPPPAPPLADGRQATDSGVVPIPLLNSPVLNLTLTQSGARETRRSALEATPILAEYPKHRQVQRRKAISAVLEALDTLEARGQANAADWLRERVVAFRLSPAGLGQYVPNAPNWFADGRYDDPPEAWKARDDPGKSSGARPYVQTREGAH
jgi:hypothetical protein